MRAAAWLLVLAACAASPVPVTTSAPTCPEKQCPTAPEKVCPTCPEKECPTSPEKVCPKPPQPVAADWHCLNLTPPHERTMSYCFPSSSVCDSYRRKAQKHRKKWGKVSPCSTQRTAFCFYRGDPTPMSRQTSCTSTLEHCEQHLALHRKTNMTKTTYLSSCKPTLNTDTFRYDDKGNPVHYTP